MIVKEAFKEACTRYPESIDALVWFSTASGLFDGVLTMEHINWARSVLNKATPSAAVINE